MTDPPHTIDDQAVDDEPGPVVRPYTLTGGRAHPTTGTLDLISMITATQAAPSPQTALELGLGPEHLTVIQHCQTPLSVAETAAALALPLGTVRVLISDLLHRNLVQTCQPQPPAALADDGLFEALLNGIRKL